MDIERLGEIGGFDLGALVRARARAVAWKLEIELKLKFLRLEVHTPKNLCTMFYVGVRCC